MRGQSLMGRLDYVRKSWTHGNTHQLYLYKLWVMFYPKLNISKFCGRYTLDCIELI